MLKSIIKFFLILIIGIIYYQLVSFIVGNIVADSAYKLYFPFSYPPKLFDNFLFSFLYFFISCGAFYIVKAFGEFKNPKKKIYFFIFNIFFFSYYFGFGVFIF